MLSGKDFVCRNLFPQDINNPLKDNRSFHDLSPLGRNIMEKFVKDNDKKEKTLRLKEIKYTLRIYCHSNNHMEKTAGKTIVYLLYYHYRYNNQNAFDFRRNDALRYIHRELYIHHNKDDRKQ